MIDWVGRICVVTNTMPVFASIWGPHQHHLKSKTVSSKVHKNTEPVVRSFLAAPRELGTPKGFPKAHYNKTIIYAYLSLAHGLLECARKFEAKAILGM